MISKYTLTIFLTLLLSFTGLSSEAQPATYKGRIEVVPQQVAQHGQLLYIEMSIRLDEVSVPSRTSIELSPWLVSSEKQVSLPVVSVKGRENYKAYRRSLLIDGKGADSLYQAVPGYGRVSETLVYRHIMTFEPWMADAQLELFGEQIGCCDASLATTTLLAERVVPEAKIEEVPVRIIPLEVERTPDFTPLLTFVVPEAEAVKTRELQAEVRLDFIVNKTDIDPAYRNNPRELARIRGIIDELRSDNSISINTLEIVGYASPEGSLANNKRLSEGRATALRDYLAARYDFPYSAYRITFGGENWNGLIRELETYQMAYKEEVLAILQYTQPDQTRKNRLMALRGGGPYREMLRNIYPGLRTAICVIDYEIKGFTAEDAVHVYRTRPQNLSLNEFYLVANTMRQGSVEFIEVFETAVRMYPNDDIANLNAAVAALQNKNTESAERYLGRITGATGLPEYLNAQGALALIKKDYATAAEYFNRAAAVGSDAAKENLQMLKKR